MDRHEGAAGSPAVAVNGPGDQFLAGAAFAADVDAGVAVWARATCLNTSCIAAETPTISCSTPAAGSDAASAGRRGGSKAQADRPFRDLQIERLDEVIEGPAADGLDGRFQFAVGRDQDHRDRPEIRVQPFHRGQPIHAGQTHVEHDRIRGLPGGQGEGFLGRCGRGDAMPHLLAQPSQPPADALLVVHDQQVCHVAIFSLGAAQE